MKNLAEIKEKNIAILGLGIEGLALYDFLNGFVAGITILDKLPISELEAQNQNSRLFERIKEGDIKSRFGETYLDNLDSFDIIFRSPGISALTPELVKAKNDGVVISSQIKLFFDLCPCKIIGVTGTKGKGTTASLIYETIKKNFELNSQDQNVYIAGNIGYPAVSLLSKIKEDDIVVLELSSFQLMDLEKSPSIAVITNLTVDHLDYHKDPKEYRSSKLTILKYQSSDDFSIINKKAEEDFTLSTITNSSIRYFGKEKDLDASVRKINGKNGVVLSKTNEVICLDDEIKLIGEHNLENIAAATLVCDILKIDHNIIKDTIKEFKGLPHRLETVREIAGIKFINDSFATNPEPTLAAINAVSGNKILILGGSSKGADFISLADRIKNTNVKAVVLIGDEADNIKSALHTVGFDGETLSGGRTMDEIVKQATSIATAGDSIILSPACASFGMFKNYKDRGDKFKSAVMSLSDLK